MEDLFYRGIDLVSTGVNLGEAAIRVAVAGTVATLAVFSGADIREVDWVVKKYGLSKGQREILHDELQHHNGPGGKVAKDVLEELAQDVKELFPNS